MPAEILGTYSSSSKDKIGTGTTAQQISSKIYWLAIKINVDLYRFNVLNDEHLPSKVKMELTSMDIFTSYTPEPGYFLDSFVPAMRSLLKTDNDAKLRFILTNLELEPEAHQTPRDCLKEKLAALFTDKNVLIKEQRDTLNAFGILSRKNHLLDEALIYYTKSLELTPDNENLLFNVARVYFELDDINKSIEYLNRALILNPDFALAKKFLSFLQKFPRSE